MKTILLFLILAGRALAQSDPGIAIAPGGCGDSKEKLAVKLDKKQHPLAKPDDGKALVYFVQDDTQFNAIDKPTVRAGIDGAWVGATHGNSYFYFSVDPGEHHLCSSWQGIGQERYVAATHFNAMVGEVYFFRVQDTWSSLMMTTDLKRVNRDEGQLLASRFPFSTSRAKK